MSDLLSENKDGLSQQERRIAGLFPKGIFIDDKDSYTLYNYMYNLSSQINFYNLKNKPDGDWQTFFTENITLVLFLLSSGVDFSENLLKFEKIQLQIQLANNDKQILLVAQVLFDFLQETVNNIKQIQSQFKKSYPEDMLIQSLADQIHDFDEEFGQIKIACQQYHAEFGSLFKPASTFENIRVNARQTLTPIFDSDAVTIREKVNSSIPHLKKIFDQARVKYNRFLGAVQYHLKNYDLVAAKHTPHLALLVAFIHLYEHLQDQINELPKRHLDFYYHTILGLQQQLAEPDNVIVFFEPELLTPSLYINQNEVLLADLKGQQPGIFKTNNLVEVTKAKIKAVKMLYIAENIWYETDLKQLMELTPYQVDCPVVDAEALQKSKVLPPSWRVFGEDQRDLGTNDRTMQDTVLQTIIASPVLYLPEGERLVIITAYIDNTSGLLLNDFINSYAASRNIEDPDFEQLSFELLNDAILLDYTSEDGWEPVQKQRLIYNKDEMLFDIKLELSAFDKAFSEYSSLIHGSINSVNLPAIRITLNNDAVVHPFSFLKQLVAKRVKIQAGVTGFRQMKLQNNIGPLSSENTFQPFGPQPLAGAFLDMRNTNVLNKYLKDLKLTIEWVGLPENAGAWKTYYENYNLNINNDSFKISLASVNNNKVIPQESDQQVIRLFSTHRDAEGREYLDPCTIINGINLKQLELSNAPLLSAENSANNLQYKQGILRLELCSPTEGFGSRIYPQVFTDVVLHNNKKFVKKQQIPNQPYIPLIKNLITDYVLEHSEAIRNSKNTGDASLKIFHVHPFGWQEAYPNMNTNKCTLFPDIDKNRNLYLGLADIIPGQELSLYFQLEDNTIVDTVTDEAVINWSYFQQNAWYPMSLAQIVSDTTDKMINTGIITLKMPTEITTNNTILPEGLFWLRMSIDGFSEVYTKIIAVFTNAVMATRVIDPESTDAAKKLEPFSIKSFDKNIKGIKKIWQPFPSFNGKPKENIPDYYVRISERLKHKQRPLTISDIEQFVLQTFPEILMVKCISANELEYLPTDPPDIKIKAILIPKQENSGFYLTDQPKVNMVTLYKVKNLLDDNLSEFVTVEVANPVYEYVKVIAMVRFNTSESFDSQFLLNKLNQDIKLFFCPWLALSVTEIKIGSKVFVSDILNYIKALPYVAYVTKFSLVHFYKKTDRLTNVAYNYIDDVAVNNNLYLTGSVAEAILIPAEQHLITIMDEDQYYAPVGIGINDMAIGTEFLVSAGNNTQTETPTAAGNATEAVDYFNLTINDLN